MVAMNDLIIQRRNRWFMGVLRSPMTRRLTLSHLLVVLLPAAVAFWLLQLHLDNRDVKRAQLTAEALLLAHVVEGRLPHRASVDFVQADGVDLEGIFESITLRDGIEVIAFGPEGEQKTLTLGRSLEAQSVLTSLGAWPAWLGPQSPVLLDHLAEVHWHISLNTATSVIQLTPKVPVIIEGQPAAVGDILSAFLSNAIQRCAWGDEIRIWTRVQDRMVVVEDTGLPLPEGMNQCLCGAGDPAALRTQEVEGFTTGLAEAAQIVTAHSGVIRAEPVQPPGAGPAFGARFLFGLPV